MTDELDVFLMRDAVQKKEEECLKSDEVSHSTEDMRKVSDAKTKEIVKKIESPKMNEQENIIPSDPGSVLYSLDEDCFMILTTVSLRC